MNLDPDAAAAAYREAMPRGCVASPRWNRRCGFRRRTRLHAALASIDAIFAIESVNAYNADVAAPVEVQEFWKYYGQLPGFAAGT